ATIPLATALRWGLAESAMAELMRGAFLMAPEPTPIDAALAEQWARDRSSGIDQETTRLEIQARLRRLCASAKEVSDDGSTDVVARMASWLADHHQDDCSLDDLARDVGLHPKYASTRFRQACGMSPWQYLMRLRIATAQRLMLTSTHTVLAIAQQAGFGSQARFYAAFKDVCGEAPGQWRRRYRAKADHS
ncbi:MAG: AraC family transcriptional regulator, partial [Planctomycetota bacterium]|nr:AraC family transcriptional regulator [Planctomycetota bacterium]